MPFNLPAGFSWTTHILAFLFGGLLTAASLTVAEHYRHDSNIEMASYEAQIDGVHILLTEFGDGPRVLEFRRDEPRLVTTVATDFDGDGFWDEYSEHSSDGVLTIGYGENYLDKVRKDWRRDSFDRYVEGVRRPEFKKV